MAEIRVFLALPLPPALIERVCEVQRRLAKRVGGVRWVRPETMHLTLKFFGDIAEESLENIAEVMLSVGGLSSPFEAEISGLGAFPSRTRPRVFWLGLGAAQPLAALHRGLEQGLREKGFPADERPFAPHLTLGRCRQRVLLPEAFYEEFQGVSCGAWTIDRVILYESRLRPGGAIHLPRHTVKLGR